jgi:pimeloyl-ACP methyl ester carboxylesterase
MWAFQTPVEPERRLTRDPSAVRRILQHAGGPAWPHADDDQDAVVHAYVQAMQVPFVAHSAMEYYRWAFRSVLRADGRRFAQLVDRQVDVPVLQVHGGQDPAILPATAQASSVWVNGPYRYVELPGAGHFLPEERPDEVNALLLDWLAGL